jgi:hypothetical protein
LLCLLPCAEYSLSAEYSAAFSCRIFVFGRNKKIRFRSITTADIHASFQPPEHAVLHWDSKQLAGPEEKLAEQLAVLVSGNTKECRQGKLLASHALESGTSAKQTEECIQLIKLWNLDSCIDTTATNTGRLQGTSVAVEKHLGCELLYLACLHHCHEFILRDV